MLKALPSTDNIEPIRVLDDVVIANNRRLLLHEIAHRLGVP